MARLPKNAAEAVGELGVAASQRVLALGPAHGYGEAFAEAVGAEGRVVIWEPAPDFEPPANVEVVDELAEDASGEVVVIWVGPVPAHELRNYRTRVSDGGAMWVVLPKHGRDVPSAVKESDLKRAMLASGWRDDRTIPLSTDSYAIRFRRRR